MTVRATTAVLAFVLAAAALAVGCGGETVEPGLVYFCPAHPSYSFDHPGDCPICNMRLEPRPLDEQAAAPASTEDGSGEGRRVLYYRHPMQPAVTSPVPTQDDMGMDYLPVFSDEASPAGPMVAGHAAVSVSEEGMRLANVRTEAAVRERFIRRVRTVGMVLPDETRVRHVQTKIAGWIEKLYVNFTGQYVRRGEPLLAIYSPELLASQEEYLLARRSAERFLDSSMPEVRRGGEDLVRSARQRLVLFDVPEAFLTRLEETGQVSRTVDLAAQASGHVVAKAVLEGTRVEPGMELFTLADLGRVWVEADVYELEAAGIAVGQQATIRLPHDPASAMASRVSYVYPELRTATRTLRVRFDLANPDLALKPGMFADVELELDAGEGVVVPDSAVIDSGLRQIVFVATGPGGFEPREVRVATRSGGRALVATGLAVGERVAVKANFLLDAESRLRAALAAAMSGERTAPPVGEHAAPDGPGTQEPP